MTLTTPARRAAVRIGCAGWSVPSRHARLFGDGDSHLARYATRFDVVEINSTFYRPHLPRTFERWAASVPPHFRFSAKLPKAITHEARLHGVGDALTAFFDALAGLGPRLGGVLVQLPPGLAFDPRIADRFFAMLRRRSDTRVACEPRHAIVTSAAPGLVPKTWYGMPAYANAQGKVVCFFKDAGKFGDRYATFGFNDAARLDDGAMWPTSFALLKLTPADEKKIAALVKKSVG